ncbi:hypothetical protein ACFL08_00350 [Patescibacteria group bacterium]
MTTNVYVRKPERSTINRRVIVKQACVRIVKGSSIIVIANIPPRKLHTVFSLSVLFSNDEIDALNLKRTLKAIISRHYQENNVLGDILSESY